VTCIDDTSRPISALSSVDLPRLIRPKTPTVNCVDSRSRRTRASSPAISESGPVVVDVDAPPLLEAAPHLLEVPERGQQGRSFGVEALQELRHAQAMSG
jgi:hypothetical protein